MKLSVIIPCYNEAQDISQNVELVKQYLIKSGIDYELIVVNDGSDDNTKEVISHFNNVISISYDQNKGKGGAVKEGISKASGDYVLFMDADLSTDLSAIDEVVKYMGKSPIIIGSRHMKKSKILTYQPLKRIIIGYGCRILVELRFHFHSTDTQCGFKAFKTDLAKKIIEKQIINGFAFDVEYLYIAKLNGYDFVEIPVIWKNDRTSTVSKGASKKFFKDMTLMKKNKHNYLF